jgi:CPA2 family monovalent cation:H+ antiporter-2
LRSRQVSLPIGCIFRRSSAINDLLAVRRIALPGAVAQIAVATALGAGVAFLWGWSFGACLVFGLALSVASTVVLLRALEERKVLDTQDGLIAVGWLIVEDLAMVFIASSTMPENPHTFHMSAHQS